MRVLFWNTHQSKNINFIISAMIREYLIDIVALAEYNDSIEDLVHRLISCGIAMSQYTTVGCEKIVFLGRNTDVKPGEQHNRFSIQIINNNYILCAVHLPSQLYAQNKERRSIIVGEIISSLHTYEERLGSEKTVLFGDINEDPYEDNCLSARGFHGIPSYMDAKKKSRMIEGISFPMLYNPMWNFYGDFTSPPGTYYYSGSTPKNAFWRVFDQVMINPCLRDEFVDESLMIITKVGEISLLDKNGHPNTEYSDHLPIVFEIKEEE